MTNVVSFIITAADKFSPVAGKITRSLVKIQRGFNKASKTVRNFGNRMASVGKSLILKTTVPLLGFATAALVAAAELETLEVAFQSLLKGAEPAREMMEKLKAFAAKTPFQLEGIGKATKQLITAGVESENMINTLQMIGDVASGANVRINEMAAIFSKAKQKGKLMTEQIDQLGERGVPAADILAKALGKTKAEIFEMAQQGKLTFGLLETSFKKLTSKGGIFFKQMELQSKTLAGIFSTLKDNVFFALASVGEQIVKTFDLKNRINALIKIIQRGTKAFKGFIKNHPGLAKLVFILAAVVAAGAPLLIFIGLLTIAIGALGLVFSPIGLAIGLVATAIIGIGTALFFAWKKSEDFRKGVINLGKVIKFVFKAAVGVVKILLNPIQALIDGFLKIKDIVQSLFKGNKNINVKISPTSDRLTSFKEGAQFKPGSKFMGSFGQQKSTSEVTVNLKDPGKSVKSIESRNSGLTRFRLGHNLRKVSE